MKVYIAGKLGSQSEKEFLEKIAKVCEDLGFEIFLPHRDVGLAETIDDVEKIFKGDIEEGFKDINLVVASLEGLHVGAGTAWELGYAYAKNIPCIGIKTDESVEEGLEYLSAILIASMDFVKSLEDLKNKLKHFQDND